MSVPRSRTSGSVPSTDSRQDDVLHLIEQLRPLVRWGQLQILCSAEGGWSVTWWEDPPGQADSDYIWERSTFGGDVTLVEALREALEEVSR